MRYTCKVSKKLQTLLYKFLYGKIKKNVMFVLNAIDNGLACDCDVSRVLIMTYL